MGLTTGERAALRWLTAVAALGSGAQLYRHWRHGGDSTPLAAEELTRQLVAVDSAQRSGRRKKSAVAPSRASGGGRRARASAVAEAGEAVRPAATRHEAGSRDKRQQVPTLGPMDVDLADSAALERLPRIGPALAARIVTDRGARGPFGSLAGLERVRGIGPKLVQLLGPLVTFSGIPRPSTVQR